MLTTTLTEIKKHKPCEDGWEKLLKGLGDEYDQEAPLPLERILEISGIDDALWVLRAVEGHDNAIRLYVCYCARYSLDIFEREHPDDKSLRQAIKTEERLAHGKATNEELDAAWAAVRDAAWAAVRDAAGIAAGAAARIVLGAAVRDAAWDAAWAAARDDLQKEFIRLCRLEGEYGEVKG